MYRIEDNVIYLTRGDDVDIDVYLYHPDGTPYDLEEGDDVIFTMRPLAATKKTVYIKPEYPTIIKHGGTVSLSHADTASLPCGAYIYDVKIVYANGTQETVVAPIKRLCGDIKPNFWLMEGV